MEIPFVRQAGGGACYQAGLAMILGYFFPQEKFTPADLDRLTHHRPGYWTFEAQLLAPLLDRKLKVELHASTPYGKLTPDLAAKRYGPAAAGKLDFQALAWARSFLKPGVFFEQELEWKTVAEKFRQGWVTFICVNEDVLVKQNLGVFLGHGLILTGLSNSQARVHDPARADNMTYPQKQLAAAFRSPGTDRACLFVKR
jgi:hypothetical protein